MVSVQPGTHRTVAEDLYDLRDGERVELIRGELRRTPLASFERGDTVMSIGAQIAAFVRQQQLGKTLAAETGFIIARNPDTLLAPDVAFVRSDRLPRSGSRRHFAELAPDLVVEVISPSDSVANVTTMVMLWLDAGVRAVWVAEPSEQTVTTYAPDGTARVLRASAGDVLDGGDVLPGFRLPLADIFV